MENNVKAPEGWRFCSEECIIRFAKFLIAEQEAEIANSKMLAEMEAMK
jgi:hypothetical protein